MASAPTYLYCKAVLLAMHGLAVLTVQDSAGTAALTSQHTGSCRVPPTANTARPAALTLPYYAVPILPTCLFLILLLSRTCPAAPMSSLVQPAPCLLPSAQAPFTPLLAFCPPPAQEADALPSAPTYSL